MASNKLKTFKLTGRPKGIEPQAGDFLKVYISFRSKTKQGAGIISAHIFFPKVCEEFINGAIKNNKVISFNYAYINNADLKQCKAYAVPESLCISKHSSNAGENAFVVSGGVKKVRPLRTDPSIPAENRFYELIFIIDEDFDPSTRSLRLLTFLEDVPTFIPGLHQKTTLKVAPIYKPLYDARSGEPKIEKDGRGRNIFRFIVIKHYEYGRPEEEEETESFTEEAEYMEEDLSRPINVDNNDSGDSEEERYVVSDEEFQSFINEEKKEPTKSEVFKELKEILQGADDPKPEEVQDSDNDESLIMKTELNEKAILGLFKRYKREQEEATQTLGQILQALLRRKT